MLKKLKENKDLFLTGAIVALTITVVAVNRRTRYVTDVMLGDGQLVVEFSDRGCNIYDLSK